MSGPSELAIWSGVLLDAGWKATVVLGAGAGVARLAHRCSAAQRHAVWAVTLVALPVLPLLSRVRGGDLAIDAPWLLAIWAVGALACLAPLGLGLVRLTRLHPRAPAAERVRIVTTTEVDGPVTWGLLRPTVLLPTCSEAWPSEWRRAALAHELAHVDRGDWLVHIGTHVVCGLFWFHPLVWVARRQLGIEAEHAADDAVLATGIAPSTYASLLVHLSTARTRMGALGASSHVAQRVHALLDVRDRQPQRWLTVGGLVLGALLVVPTVGALPGWTSSPQPLTCLPEDAK